MAGFKKTFLIIFIVIGTLFLITLIFNYFISAQFRKISETSPYRPAPQFQFPENYLAPEKLTNPQDLLKYLEEFIKKRRVEKKDFISPDGKLKLEYTSEWIEIDQKDFEKFFPESIEKKYNLKTLFAAQKFGLGKVSLLFVKEMLTEKTKTFDEIIDEMEKSNKELGWKMEVFEKEEREKEFVFEARYENKYINHSKEKMLTLPPEGEKKTVFLIAYLTFERDWEDLKKEADEIINSAQLIE